MAERHDLSLSHDRRRRSIWVGQTDTAFLPLVSDLRMSCLNSQDWKSVTIEQFIGVVDDYIRWYNEKRIKISLGALSPIEYRVSLGLAA